MIWRLEVVRLWRSKRPLIAVVALLFFLAMMLVGFYTYARAETGGRADFRYTYENRSYFNGLTFALYAFYFGFLLILPIFIATEGGAQIAGDTSSRTLLLCLTRPVSRTRLFFGKFLLSSAFAGLLAGGFLGISLIIGLMAVGWGDLDLYPGVLQMTDRHQHLGQQVALVRFFLVWPAASLALLTPLSLAYLFSTWVKNPINAVGMAFSLYLIFYVIAEIHFFKDLRPYLFTTYMPYWRELFQEQPDLSLVLNQALRLSGFTLLFLALAFRRFRRREEQ